jgi:hypothetical protein
VADRSGRFDPYAVFRTLDAHGVQYVLIGGLARVLQGTEELTRGTDIVPSTRGDNLRRLDAALRELRATRADGRPLDPAALEAEHVGAIELATDHGEVKIVVMPEGTRGYDDLRRAANREPLGQGLRPSVTSIGDLARMASAYDRERYRDQVRQLRRLTALERSRSRVIER